MAPEKAGVLVVHGEIVIFDKGCGSCMHVSIYLIGNCIITNKSKVSLRLPNLTRGYNEPRALE